MGLKKFRPTTPTLRHTVMPDYSEITRSRPVRSLTQRLYKTGGRDNYGHVSMRWISGGHKQRYRIVDFRRDKDGVGAKVASIEYDPNRSARIALLHYQDGGRRYIVAPDRIRDRDGSAGGGGGGQRGAVPRHVIDGDCAPDGHSTPRTVVGWLRHGAVQEEKTGALTACPSTVRGGGPWPPPSGRADGCGPGGMG